MFVDVVISTMDVDTLNVALVAPAGIVTLAGTLAAELLRASPTLAPPAGAAPLCVTVAREDCSPPTTLHGLSVSEATRCSRPGFTVNVDALYVPALLPRNVNAVEGLTTLQLT